MIVFLKFQMGNTSLERDLPGFDPKLYIPFHYIPSLTFQMGNISLERNSWLLLPSLPFFSSSPFFSIKKK